MDWINLDQDGVQWWAFVNTVMNLEVPQKSGIFWVAEQLLACQEGLSSMEFVRTGRLKWYEFREWCTIYVFMDRNTVTKSAIL
jgi:hypothetical protein